MCIIGVCCAAYARSAAGGHVERGTERAWHEHQDVAQWPVHYYGKQNVRVLLKRGVRDDCGGGQIFGKVI